MENRKQPNITKKQIMTWEMKGEGNKELMELNEDEKR